MASSMGWWLVCLGIFGFSSAEVVLNGEWKENSGLEVTCAWETWLNDSLQSVNLYRNDVLYTQFRPQIDGLHYHREMPNLDFLMTVSCQLVTPQGQKGSCKTAMVLYQNATEDTYKCEVSGEKPKFRQEYRTYTVFVPPSNPEITATTESQGQETRRILNCTSSGLPAPTLVWTVDGQRVPADFTHTTWNSKTKLWHSWSTLNPQKDNVVAKCAPEVKTRQGTVEHGREAEFSGASWMGVSKFFVAVSLVMLILFR